MTHLAADGGESVQNPINFGNISGKGGLAPQCSPQKKKKKCGVQMWCGKAAAARQPTVSRCCEDLQEKLKLEAIFASLRVPQC